MSAPLWRRRGVCGHRRTAAPVVLVGLSQNARPISVGIALRPRGLSQGGSSPWAASREGNREPSYELRQTSRNIGGSHVLGEIIVR